MKLVTQMPEGVVEIWKCHSIQAVLCKNFPAISSTTGRLVGSVIEGDKSFIDRNPSLIVSLHYLPAFSQDLEAQQPRFNDSRCYRQPISLQKLRTALGNPLPTFQTQLYADCHRVLLCLSGGSRGCLKSEAR